MPVRIAAARRSPFTGVEGALAGWHPVDLAASLMNATVTDPAAIDEVWLGCAEPVGAQGADMARAAILAAGWPDRIGGTVLDRGETSGTAALHAACAALEAGDVTRAIVVGVCSASVVAPGASALARTYGRPWGDGPAERVEGDGGLLPAPTAADRAAAATGIGRTEQDAWTTGSHERRGLVASSAIEPTDARPGDRAAIQRGTPIAADALRERPDDPSTMPPSFDPDGTVTGFTFSPPADGVTVIELTTADAAGPQILARSRSAGHPLDPTGAAEAAIRAALDRAGLAAEAIDRWEIAEPTAAATLLVIRRASLDPAHVNINGATLAVGDAAAAEELRLVVDGVGHAAPGDVVGCVAFGPTGAAVTLLACP